MFYTIYKVTHKISGKHYIGAHKTKNLDDGYMGSGKYLKAAIEKHGLSNFSKEILHVFDNPQEMFAKEAELVNAEFLSEANTYNLKVGGFGGWDYANSQDICFRSERSKNNIRKAIATIQERYGVNTPAKLPSVKHKISSTITKQYKCGRKSTFTGQEFKGKSHSEESKEIMRAKAKLRTGEKNSSFGTMWITNPTTNESKKMQKNEKLPSGWVKGRKLKSC